MRQPVRTLLLVLLIGVAAFALVARVSEYVVVRGEIRRIESLYRSVGVLSPTRFYDFTTDHDVSRALDIIESNRHVAISDARRFTQGVMDRQNMTALYNRTFFNPSMNDISVPLLDHYIIGSLTISPRLSVGERSRVILEIATEEMIAGDPTAIRIGDTVFTNERGQSITLRGRMVLHLYVTDEEANLIRSGEWAPFGDLGVGDSALFRVTQQYVIVAESPPWSGFVWYVRGVYGDDGFSRLVGEYNPRMGGGYVPQIETEVRNPSYSWRSDVVFAVPLSDEEKMRTVLAAMQDDIDLINENSHSFLVVESQDLTAVPRFMDRSVTRTAGSPTFPGGRWFTAEDYGRPVAVVPASLAVRRGLRVGETFTITLRDNPRPNWIDTPTGSVWARGVENWWDNPPQGWWAMTDSTHQNRHDFATHELELEVIGLYWFGPPIFTNFTTSEIFIPAGVMPAGFGWDDSPLLTGMYSFVLNSPRNEESFLRQTRAALAEAGFVARFIPSGFDTLAATIDPINFSVTVNLFVFGVAALLIFIFVIYLYIRQWRKSVAIAQALGIPPVTVQRQLFTPVIFFWLPAVVAGSVLAWFFALEQAQDTLTDLAAYDAEVLLAPHWVAIFGAAVCVFILVGVWLAARNSINRPVLEQLQGGGGGRKVKHIDPGVLPEGFVVGDFVPVPVAKTARAARVAPLRHSVRHIIRTPAKTALVLVLSLLLVFSMGWLYETINFTEAEIERLWETTVIEAEILQDIDNYEPNAWWSPHHIIAPDIWDRIEYSGFLGEAYLESMTFWGEAAIMWVSHLRGLVYENTRTITDEQLGVICANMELEFMEGFGFDDFVFSADEIVPLVVRREMAEEIAEAVAQGYVEEIFQFMMFPEAQIIGVFDGGLQRGINRLGDDIPMWVLPIEANRYHFNGGWGWQTVGGVGEPIFSRSPYTTARFTIDPARNREIDSFREIIEPFLGGNRFGTIILAVNDDIIHDVILPMEQNLSLLRVLYPIAIAVAFALGVGMALLAMLQNAKNAAIMRALGKPKFKTQLTLCAEQIIVCFVGVLGALLGLIVFGAAFALTPFVLAGMYVVGVVLGSAVGAFVISAKTPIELLQVRE